MKRTSKWIKIIVILLILLLFPVSASARPGGGNTSSVSRGSSSSSRSSSGSTSRSSGNSSGRSSISSSRITVGRSDNNSSISRTSQPTTYRQHYPGDGGTYVVIVDDTSESSETNTSHYSCDTSSIQQMAPADIVPDCTPEQKTNNHNGFVIFLFIIALLGVIAIIIALGGFEYLLDSI